MNKNIALYCFHKVIITYNKSVCYYTTLNPNIADMDKDKRYDYCRYSHGIKVLSVKYGSFNLDKRVLGNLNINVI